MKDVGGHSHGSWDLRAYSVPWETFSEGLSFAIGLFQDLCLQHATYCGILYTSENASIDLEGGSLSGCLFAGLSRAQSGDWVEEHRPFLPVHSHLDPQNVT